MSTQCEGCMLLMQGCGVGGENQQAHMGMDGCFGNPLFKLERKLEEYAEAVRRAHTADKMLEKAEKDDVQDDLTIFIESSDEWGQHVADIKREIMELLSS